MNPAFVCTYVDNTEMSVMENSVIGVVKNVTFLIFGLIMKYLF